MASPLPTIADIALFLEEWAPPSSAQSYDNVGLQVGDPGRRVSNGLIALDMTPAVLDEAAANGATLIITHHPLIFQPLLSVTPQAFNSNLALKLAESRIALYSIHTNLDAASGGVSFALAELLGVKDLEFLDADEDDGRTVGLGAIGALDDELRLTDFLASVAERLNADSLRYAGNSDAIIKRVAVCGGAGADFVDRAIAAGADAYVTSDVKYHRYFDVLDNDGRPRMAFIDAGHYETEAMTESLLLNALAERFPAVEWVKTEMRTSPMQTFIPHV